MACPSGPGASADTPVAVTESVAVRILDIVERHLDMQAEAADIIAAARDGSATADTFERLAEINTALGDDLTSMMIMLRPGDAA